MWRSLIQPTPCVGLYAPSPPNPALPGRAGCPLPTWTRGSRYLAGGLRGEGLWVTSLEDSGIVVLIWRLGAPCLHRGRAGAQPTSWMPVSLQLSPEWGPTEAPEFPGEAVSEDEYRTRLR